MSVAASHLDGSDRPVAWSFPYKHILLSEPKYHVCVPKSEEAFVWQIPRHFLRVPQASAQPGSSLGQTLVRVLRTAGPRSGSPSSLGSFCCCICSSASEGKLGPLWGSLSLSFLSSVSLDISSEKVPRSGLACGNKGLFVPHGLLLLLSFPRHLLLL